ncbi:MAG: hypothetical protein ABJL72_07035 [Roseobacter sp.]
MKEMLLAFVAIAVIAVGANYGLHAAAGFSSQQRTQGDAVRLD